MSTIHRLVSVCAGQMHYRLMHVSLAFMLLFLLIVKIAIFSKFQRS